MAAQGRRVGGLRAVTANPYRHGGVVSAFVLRGLSWSGYLIAPLGMGRMMDHQEIESGYRPSFGEELASLRRRRRYSQLKLSQLADVSARHLSFLETGRARPSRHMVLRLAATLGLGRTDASNLLQAAGFATDGAALPRVSRFGAASQLDMELLYAIEDATEVGHAIAMAAAALDRLGLSQFFLGTMSSRSTCLVDSIRHHDLSHAPLGWMGHYRERGFGVIDPLIVATAVQHLPFFWSEVLTPRLRADPAVNCMLGEASEFGIVNGYVASIRRPDGKVHAISCMARFVSPNDPAARATARAITTAILHKADDHGIADRNTPLRLESRLLSILKHLLNGMGADDTAQRLGLSDMEFTAEVSRLCRMFGTSDALDAALRARRYGLVHV